MARSYKDLDIYKDSLHLYFDIHQLTMKLPKHELYELGSQLRRAADSTISNIVEGYGRRRYKAEFIRFLTFSHASNLEVNCHLEKIIKIYPDLKDQVALMLKANDQLSRKIYNYLAYIQKYWNPKTIAE